ncbi:hypothetical protein PG614_05415 [Riemerella anatipestifer]|nr:hypothetical protein [Riemerella anatipestifer]
MKKTTKLSVSAFLGLSLIAYGQTEGKVGINTSSPNATLEIKPNTTNLLGATNEGIIVPKLSKTRVAKMPSPQEGTLVYVVDDAKAEDGGGTIASYTGTDARVTDITEKGYYFYNKSNTLSGGIWKPLGGTSPVTANIYTTDGTLAGNRTVDMNGKNLQFTGNGNFGIGTDTPETKLDIEGTVKIVDGTQGAGKVLTSDSNGNASWETPTMSYAYTIGMGDKNNTYPATDLAAVNDKYKYTGMKITLPTKGKYAVLLDLNISLAPSLSVSPQLPHNPVYNPNINRLSSGESIIIRGAFWDEILSEGIDKNTDNVPIKNKANSMWRGEVIYPLYMRRASNTMYIENTTSGPKTFYFYAMASIENPSPSAPIRYIYELGSGRWAEESLLAFKIGE